MLSNNKLDWEKYWLKFDKGSTPASMMLSDMLLPYLNNETKIIDIGCGYGRISEQVAKLGCNVIGIDINENEINEAKRRCKGYPNAKFEVMSGSNIVYANNTFDVAILLGTIGGVDVSSRKKIISEVYRVLREGGLIYVSELTIKTGDIEREKQYLRDMEYTNEYGSRIVFSEEGEQGDILFICKHFTKEEIEKLLSECGFKNISSKEDYMMKKNIIVKGIEKRKQISVIGIK